MTRRKECRNTKHFGDVFRAGIKLRGGHCWQWKKHLAPWLGEKLNGARFGSPDYDWSEAAADELAAEFINEASTW